MSEETKARLIASAIKLFAERSYENTRVEEISAAAGVTKGGFYHHYASKEDLLLNIQESAVDEVIEVSEAILARELTPSETLRELIRLQMRIILERREALLASVSERKSLEPKKWALLRKKRDRIEQIIVDTITLGQERGAFVKSHDARLQAYGILGMCYWSNVWYRANRGWDVNTIAEEFANLAISGLDGR